MARGGINKALVIKARENLVSRGENPSIDAIRVELGNTGSKTTIHRYLREIEENAATQLDNEALLSKPIKELVVRLTATLKQEAQAVVDESQHQHQLQVDTLTRRIQELEALLSQTQQSLEITESDLQACRSELHASLANEEALKAKCVEAKQTEENLQTALTEKQKHIDSLEEKHRHNREAMAHYRESVKEQREQDQRKFEQDAQQRHVEIRSLNQSLSVKQSEITQLNKDNGRLVAELGTLQKQCSNLDSKQQQLSSQLAIKTEEAETFKSQVSELNAHIEALIKLKEENKTLHAWKSESTVSMAKLEAALCVKSEMIDRLLEESKQRHDKLEEKTNLANMQDENA